MKNVNGLGALVFYDPAMIKDVKTSQNPYIASMENMSIDTPFDDGTGALLNLAFMNRGDKPLTSGNHILATITMTAKQDMNLKTKAADSFLTIENGILIGPNYSTVKAKINEEPQIPDAPAVKDVTLKQEDVTMTITNEFLPTDDGTNVEKMINEKKFDGLFNGNKACLLYTSYFLIQSDKSLKPCFFSGYFLSMYKKTVNFKLKLTV